MTAVLQEPQQAATNEFTMDPNLLISVIKAQAGTLTKALLEGVMNSIDAGASKVNISMSHNVFVIDDDGRGFTSQAEVKNWFGRFGTPHQEGDSIYGRFRMGRGQMFAFASTKWQSGCFVMEVDIEKRGLTYDLSYSKEPFKGCRVTGLLYKELSSSELRDALSELKHFVAYTPVPVYVNGELFGSSPAKAKGWSFEDENGYFKVQPDADELHIYNQGVFVCTKHSYSTGMGGVLVSKKPLKVNFARNDILERQCEVWAALSAKLRQVVMNKLASAAKLTDEDRRYLARRVTSSDFYGMREKLLKAKLVTDPTGRHHPLESLRNYKRFAYAETATPLACATHGKGDTFVVTDAMLNRFGVYSVNSLLEELSRVAGLIDPNVEVATLEEIPASLRGTTSEASQSDLTKKQLAAYAALSWLNVEVQVRLNANGFSSPHRELLVGRHKKNMAVAWTDGKTYVTANIGHLKLFEKGLDGVSEWILTLVHEYMHDTDDSESHDHGEVFYAKYHDAVFSGSALNLGTLAQQGLVKYLAALRKNGLSVPRELRKQLRPDIDLS